MFPPISVYSFDSGTNVPFSNAVSNMLSNYVTSFLYANIRSLMCLFNNNRISLDRCPPNAHAAANVTTVSILDAFLFNTDINLSNN